MKKILACFAALFLVVMMSATVFAESSVTRIKDIAKVQGVRSNQGGLEDEERRGRHGYVDAAALRARRR